MEGKVHFWHIMLYNIKKGKNATETQTKKICAVYGGGAVTDQTCQVICKVSWYNWHLAK